MRYFGSVWPQLSAWVHVCKCVGVKIRAAAIGIFALIVAAGCTASESAASTAPSVSTGKATRHSINCSSFQGLAEKVIYARGCTDETFTGGRTARQAVPWVAMSDGRRGKPRR